MTEKTNTAAIDITTLTADNVARWRGAAWDALAQDTVQPATEPHDVEKNNLDYIRLGLAIKTLWPEIDFEMVDIIEVLFGRSWFELPALEDKIEAVWIDGFTYEQCFSDYPDGPQFKKETIKMHRFRSKQVEFTAGYAPVSNKLLVGTKE